MEAICTSSGSRTSISSRSSPASSRRLTSRGVISFGMPAHIPSSFHAQGLYKNHHGLCKDEVVGAYSYTSLHIVFITANIDHRLTMIAYPRQNKTTTQARVVVPDIFNNGCSRPVCCSVRISGSRNHRLALHPHSLRRRLLPRG